MFTPQPSAASAPPFVIALVATYHRSAELNRLLDSLEKIPVGLGAVVVTDNAAETATAQACAGRAMVVHHLPQRENLGCGGGLRCAEESALGLYGKRLTHLWILDDEAVVLPDSLGQLLGALGSTDADAAVPMLIDAAGHVGWFAGLVDAEKFRLIRHARTPAKYLVAGGPEPVPFSWSPGICLLVTRRGVETVGLHRADFWIRGEDIEFSLRLTARLRGVFVPTAAVQHLVPPVEASIAARRAEYFKQCAHMQNVTYIGLYLPHGHRIVPKIPGHYYRFLREARWTPRAFGHAARAFWWGAIRGRPAGTICWGD